jgi:hypothetical protein
VVGFTTGSRGEVPGKTCEKRIRNNNNNSYNNERSGADFIPFYCGLESPLMMRMMTAECGTLV